MRPFVLDPVLRPVGLSGSANACVWPLELTPRGRVLRLAVRDAVTLMIPLGGRPVHCRTVSSIPGLPLDASSSRPRHCENQEISLNAPKYLLGHKTDLS